MKNLNNYIKLSLTILLIFSSGSCTDHFEDLNNDPNNPVDVPAIHLFTQVIIRSVKNELGYYTRHFQDKTLSQQWSLMCYKSDERYTPLSLTLQLDQYYMTDLLDLEIVIRKTREDISNDKDIERNTSLLAAAKIMRVWIFHLLTDIFGDIPYSEALQGLDVNGILTPKFDTQESIYIDLIKELDEVNALFDLSHVANFGEGDLFFDGDPALWKKFGNSLKLRILNRSAGTPWFFTYDMIGTGPFTTTAGDAAYPNADAEMAAILNDPAGFPVLTGNEDNVQLFYPGLPYRQPIYNIFYTRTGFVISGTMVDWLEARNDPRLPVFAQQTPDYVNGTSTDPYVGEQNGAPYCAADAEKISLLGLRIGYDETAPLYILTYDEIEFIKAEYFLRQGNDALAKAAYEAGITASMERWDTLMGDYLSEPEVAWDSATYDGEKYQRIIEQKWAGCFTQGWQAWHEARRTGFPARIFEYELEATYFPDMGMPVRLCINEGEVLLNWDNFLEAQKRQNIEETNYGLFSTDGIKSQMWWHTRKNPVPTEIDPPGKGGREGVVFRIVVPVGE
ncbi:MAG: SusD/RagB family nutrient-binding outer membrane lipoprotein [Bacteroidales bacterium]|nr:SusD/RagB family nutrient-binding outer membrane lipoprotein [Bacteroidales bacterium]